MVISDHDPLAMTFQHMKMALVPAPSISTVYITYNPSKLGSHQPYVALVNQICCCAIRVVAVPPSSLIPRRSAACQRSTSGTSDVATIWIGSAMSHASGPAAHCGNATTAAKSMTVRMIAHDLRLFTEGTYVHYGEVNIVIKSLTVDFHN